MVYLYIIIYFEFYHQKDKLCKYTGKIGISMMPVHLNDNKIGGILVPVSLNILSLRFS